MGRRSRTPNIKRQERRKQSLERRRERTYKEIRQDKGVKDAAKYKANIIQKTKERYEKEHENIATIREKMTNGEINQAIRFLYDRGVIKGAFEYYEDFVEKHQHEFDMDEIGKLLDNYEKEQEEGFNEAIDILKGGTTYTPTKRRSRGKFMLDFT